MNDVNLQSCGSIKVISNPPPSVGMQVRSPVGSYFIPIPPPPPSPRQLGVQRTQKNDMNLLFEFNSLYFQHYNTYPSIGSQPNYEQRIQVYIFVVLFLASKEIWVFQDYLHVRVSVRFSMQYWRLAAFPLLELETIGSDLGS